MTPARGAAAVGLVLAMGGVTAVESLAGSLHPASVGRFALVRGTLLDRHATGGPARRVRNGAAVQRGDIITLARGATARVVFTNAARRAGGALFVLRAPHAITQELLPGAAHAGSRVAFAYDGRYITSEAGPGVDAATRLIVPRTAHEATVRIRFTAPHAKHAVFACGVDHGPMHPCRSPDVLRLAPGEHSIAVQTVGVFAFRGPVSTARVRIGPKR